MRSYSQVYFLSCIFWTISVLTVWGKEISAENGSQDQFSTEPKIVPQIGSNTTTMVVHESIKVTDLVTISEERYEAELILELVQQWKGMDLHASNISLGEEGLKEDVFVKMKHTASIRPEELWIPDPIKAVNFRKFEVLNERIQVASQQQGLITRFQRVKLTVGCKMFLTLFPHDSHLCSVILQGSGSNQTHTGIWESTIPLCGDLHAYQFHVKSYSSFQMGSLFLNLIVSRGSTMQIFSQMYSPVMLLTILALFTLSIGTHKFRIALSTTCLICLFITTTIFWSNIPRHHGGQQTAIEHFIVICIGLVFQVVLTNVLLYGYLSKSTSSLNKSNEDIEADADRGAVMSNNNDSGCIKAAVKKNEEHILKMGKFHQFVYFKCMKPAKKHVPIIFLLLNVIYWPIVLFISSGLPKGFQHPQECPPLGF